MQNSITSYLQEFDVCQGRKLVLERTGAKELSTAQEFAIKHNSYGNINCAIEWLQGKIPLQPDQLAKFQVDSMPEFLRDAYAHSTD